MSKSLALILVVTSFCLPGFSQDSLPNITVKNKSGKVILSWTNPFRDVVLINIQRSADSLKGFKTILSVADPTAVTNGYLDNKTPNAAQYYRLYVQQDGGKYFFTGSFKPVLDTARAKPKTVIAKAGKSTEAPEKETPASSIASPESTDMEKVEEDEFGSKKRMEKNTAGRKKLSNTRSIGVGNVEADAPEDQEFKAPSVHVYTNPQGQVVMVLPQEKTNQFTLKFFKDDGTPLFTMNKVRDSHVTIDKTNFIRSGWFRFELYENNAMKEKNRFFIPRENF